MPLPAARFAAGAVRGRDSAATASSGVTTMRCSSAALRAQIANRPLPAITGSTLTEPEVLVHDILESRRRGYFVTRGENVPDVWAVSAFLSINSEMLAVAIAGPQHRMENKVAEYAQLLLATCSFISRQWDRP